MRYLNRIAALAGVSLAACGGGTPIPPDLTPAAIAEATKTLESAKPAVERAYAANNRTFPGTANAPIPTVKAADAVYVRAINYTGASPFNASVVVTLTGTGNSIIDGKFLGVFATGQIDGTVSWMCGTASATTSTAVSAIATMYPYLPAACQH